ncbi:MAG: hypothetical protein WC615_00220 [Mucilaginibacter sp.]
MKNKLRFYKEGINTPDNRILIFEVIKLFIQNNADQRRINLVTAKLNQKELLNEFFNDPNAAKNATKGVKFPGTPLNYVHGNLSGYFTDTEVVIALGLNSYELLELDKKSNSKCLIAIPSRINEIEKWVRITNAQTLPAENVLRPYAEPECILKEALKAVTSINPAHTGLRDHEQDAIKSMFSALKKYAVPAEKDIIESHLYRSYELPKSLIDAILKVYEAVSGGKKIAGKVSNEKSSFERWKANCK